MNVTGTSVLIWASQWYIGLVAAMYGHDVTVKSFENLELTKNPKIDDFRKFPMEIYYRI